MYTVWSGSVLDPIWIRPDWPLHVVRGLFSFRHGGVSTGDYHSLNVGLHVGDRPDCVIQNRRLCADQLGSTLDEWVVAEQVHGTTVAVVDEGQAGRGAYDATSAVAGADALVTDVPGITLVVMAADCVPLLFFDRRRRAVAAAHSGWKGTVGHIAQRVIETMARTYGTDPADVEVWLGPSIRRCCYEVSDAVAQPVMREFGKAYLIPRFNAPGKYWLSLQSCICKDLVDAGVPPSQIVDCGVCTSCQSTRLFSHRADAGRTGRQLAAIRLTGPLEEMQGARCNA